MQEVPPPFDAYARNSDPETSHAAAASMAPHLPALEVTMLELLRRAGSYGLTSYEMAAGYGLERVTVSPRFKPMERKGVIRDSGHRRQGPSGRMSIVWIALK